MWLAGAPKSRGARVVSSWAEEKSAPGTISKIAAARNLNGQGFIVPRAFLNAKRKKSIEVSFGRGKAAVLEASSTLA
jgi:hypothetical protein